jgi:hypothetical protein
LLLSLDDAATTGTAVTSGTKYIDDAIRVICLQTDLDDAALGAIHDARAGDTVPLRDVHFVVRVQNAACSAHLIATFVPLQYFTRDVPVTGNSQVNIIHIGTDSKTGLQTTNPDGWSTTRPS